MLHTMQLVDFAFEAIAKGEKTYELRLHDEKRKQLRLGDPILFCRKNSPDQVLTRVETLLPFEDFHALYAALPLERCGYDEKTLPHAHPSDMERFYSPEDIRRYGVLAIGICRQKDQLMRHYDLLLEENNDPVLDEEPLRSYMNRWDGEAFLRLLDPSPTQKALEIGMGTGRLALRFAPLLGEVTGIDLSYATVQRAREHLADFPNVKPICGDFLSYDFPSGFDCIYSSLSFLHVEEKEAAIQKAAALLPKGGRLLLSLDKSRDVFLPSPTGQLKLYPDDPDALVDLMEKASLSLTAREETEAATLLLAVKK